MKAARYARTGPDKAFTSAAIGFNFSASVTNSYKQVKKLTLIKQYVLQIKHNILSFILNNIIVNKTYHHLLSHNFLLRDKRSL